MKKMNPFFKITFFVSLFTLPFLIGCAETDREMMFPDTDIPESVTVMIKDVPEGAEFELNISMDYSEHKDNFGSPVIVYNHNYMEKYFVTQDFSETMLFDSEEPRISVKLTCTMVDPINENSASSVHLIVQFNGDGNFDRGNHNLMQPIKLGSFISVQSAFSRYDGVSYRITGDIDPEISNFRQ